MADLRAHLEWLHARLTEDETDGCGCQPSFSGDTLVVDATACEAEGQLEVSPDCRETVLEALTRRDADTIRTEAPGIERVYEDDAAALLVAAGRFVESVAFHDERLAARTRRDPLAGAREATGRADVTADIAAETGLAELALRATDYETALSPSVGPPVSRWRVDTTPQDGWTLLDVRELDTGAIVRRYAPSSGPERYVLDPIENRLDRAALRVLDCAYERLARGEFEGGDRAPARAVRADRRNETPDSALMASETEVVADVLRKHTRGYGLLEDLFADEKLSDVFVTAPAGENALRVNVDGETLVSNVRLTEQGVDALASRFRRESGRAFSRADPTLDAAATVSGRRIRVAGVTEPTSDGSAFAFRAQDRAVWTLPALVDNDTLTAEAAALLSVAVERGAATLSVGPRGAGKTTLLGALLWELPPTVRTVVIEDTPELPVGPLQETGRDVQALVTSDESEELSTAEALRTALRLGNGALAVGEIRGAEAPVLYEAMRVGANSEAVLGTVHGDGAEAVYERVVTDLGVSESAFGVTDLVVTCEITGAGERRVSRIEEVLGGETPVFETLFERGENGLEPTGRLDRGESRLLDSLTAPEERYSDLRERLANRTRLLAGLAERARTDPTAVTNSHEYRGTDTTDEAASTGQGTVDTADDIASTGQTTVDTTDQIAFTRQDALDARERGNR